VGASLAPRYDPEAAALIDTLSDRERDVLLRLARGRSNAEIGAEIHLGTGTVKDHVSALLAKLGVPGRVQAALAAERGGLLEGTG
jgi:DNA-binding NarL/FixJ family response regulator